MLSIDRFINIIYTFFIDFAIFATKTNQRLKHYSYTPIIRDYILAML